MRISNKLPQFGKTAALIVVMGKQVAEFYLASDGEIELLHEFSVDGPEYSDREGIFMNYDIKGDKIRLDFLRLLKRTLTRIDKERQFDALYLFVPAYIRMEAVGALPASARQRLVGMVTGTYYREHPFSLLTKLQLLKPVSR